MTYHVSAGDAEMRERGRSGEAPLCVSRQENCLSPETTAVRSPYTLAALSKKLSGVSGT